MPASVRPTSALVSCLMPTADRRSFVTRAIEQFQRQDYAERELVVLDDGKDAVADLVPEDPRVRYVRIDPGLRLGAKRNRAVEEARGDVLVHWDDDDWHAPWRLSYQVGELLRREADVCGLDRIYFYDPDGVKAWRYVYPRGNRPWLAGGTLCYTRAFWERNRFPNVKVGEDNRFIWNATAARIVALEKEDFYVARIHDGNTSRKRPSGARWQSRSVDTVRALVQEETEKPLVSCIMTTADRRAFVPEAVRYFLRQDYPRRELLVLDDGKDAVGDVLPNDPMIRYVRLNGRRTLGAKRNFGCEKAHGEVIAIWDDDDWYAPNRLSYQVAPLLAGTADLTVLGETAFYLRASREFWAITPELHKKMFYRGMVGGTQVFLKKLWGRNRYPERNVAEDVMFIRDVTRCGARVETMANEGVFVYCRHDANSWRFRTGAHLDRGAWRKIGRPSFLPAGEFDGRENSQDEAPLVSCILATGDRRSFLAQAVKYFERQTYANKELVVVDDGSVPCADLVPEGDNVRYIRLDEHTPLGKKLNLGIEQARGAIIQKLDDDDYYHPEFLATTVAALRPHESTGAIVALDCFLVLLASTGELRYSGIGWSAGPTLCFFRDLWRRNPFRDVPRAVDYYFLKDHDVPRVKVKNPELLILVRHGGNHLWTQMGKVDVADHFRAKPAYKKSLRECLPEEDLAFYEGLRAQGGEGEMLSKTKGPDREGREAMYYAERQDFAYQRGAYEYLESVAMVPRLATIAAYVHSFGLKCVLDVGCGTAHLLRYLHPDVTYVGLDISPTAVREAEQRFSGRPRTYFYAADFRRWECPVTDLDGVIWAGIGCTWTKRGKRGSHQDWGEILEIAERPLVNGGHLILELVTVHWPKLSGLVEGRYVYETGCDVDCLQSEESPKRSIRVFRKKGFVSDGAARPPVHEWCPPAGSSLVPASLARRLIELTHPMGQATDKASGNLGFGLLYYSLVRTQKPETVVSIGSYRGFSSICLALALVDNGKGICHFIDPGKVDKYWHDPRNVEALERRFGVHGHWRHLRKTSQEVVAEGLLEEPIDVLLIDGDHSYQGVKFDFDHFGARVRPGGLVLFHDATQRGKGYTPWEVPDFLDAEVFGQSQYEALTLPLDAGLTVVRKRP